MSSLIQVRGDAVRSFSETRFLRLGVPGNGWEKVGPHTTYELVSGASSVRLVDGTVPEYQRDLSQEKTTPLTLRDMTRGTEACKVPSITAVSTWNFIEGDTIASPEKLVQQHLKSSDLWLAKTDPEKQFDAAQLAALLQKQATAGVLCMSGLNALHVIWARPYARVFVEQRSGALNRKPQNVEANGTFACENGGPVHLVGGVQAYITGKSLAELSFDFGIKLDTTAAGLLGSGLGEENIKALIPGVEKQDESRMAYLTQDKPVEFNVRPGEGMLLREIEGEIEVRYQDQVVYTLRDQEDSLLCHESTEKVQLIARKGAAKLLGLPFAMPSGGV